MRQRLTSRVAEDLTVRGRGETKESKGSGIDNDSYNMNDTGHEKNDPTIGEYAKGDPSAWAEDPNMKNPASDDSKREETGHAPLIDKSKYAATEAIANVRRLEEKAVRAIVASQRMLPGESKQVIEQQAAAFMHMPDECLNGTLSRQEKLARKIAGEAEEVAEEATEAVADAPAEAEACDKPDENADSDSDKDVAKKGVLPPALQKINDEKKDAKGAKDDKLPEFLQKKLASMALVLAQEIVAGMNTSDASDENAEEGAPAASETSKTPAVDEKKEEDDADDDEKKDDADDDADDDEITFGEDEEGKGKDANDTLLAQIFNNVSPSAGKKGAAKLGGMVKKEASDSGNVNLDSILMSNTPPDINHLFQQ